MSDDLHERERTWQALTLPHKEAATLPLDATITAASGTVPLAPLPHISVGESSGEHAVPSPLAGPDLEVLGLLGEGGMGRVQVARQRSLEREVALKRPHAGASDRDAALLRAEAVVTGHLEHPNIIPVHALGVDDGGRPLIVMKRVEGVSWRELLRDDDHPGWARREPNREARQVWHLQILAQLCNAIAFAHSRGVVHRDMKPGNVMVGEFGEVYLIDWGVAVKTRSQARTGGGSPVLVGTPAYMAPEMAQGGVLDERTDVYLLGATLHEVITGQWRHDGADLHDVTLQALASLPFAYPDSVPDELASLANRATARDPADRPPDVLAFRQALLDHLLHRASLRLSAEADRGLAAVEADPASARDRAIEECRFGYREALREWPANPDALRGMRRCATATVRLELARGNAAGARAALGEIPDASAELVDEIARLEAALAADQEERARLRQLAADADSTAGEATRILLVVILFVLASGATVYACHLQSRGRIGPRELIALPGSIAAVAVAVLVFARRRLLVNAFSRRLVAWFMVVALTLVADRVVGQAVGLSPPQQFALDGVLVTALLATGAIYGFRWIWWCAALTAAATVVSVLAPEVSLVAFGGTVSATIVLAAFLMRRER